jgi:hypothetical protein
MASARIALAICWSLTVMFFSPLVTPGRERVAEHIVVYGTAESLQRTLADASAKRQVSEEAFPHEFVLIIAFTHLHTA